MFQLGREELNGQRQARRGQDLFVDIGDDVLSGEVAGDPLAEDAEEIDLLNIFFTVQEAAGGHAMDHTNFGVRRESPLWIDGTKANQSGDSRRTPKLRPG